MPNEKRKKKTLKKTARRSVPVYDHKDSQGMRWRFVGSRPVSELADKVMRDA